MADSKFAQSISNISDHPDYEGTEFNGNPPSGGSGGMRFSFTDLRLNVSLLNASFLILLTTFGAAFLWFIDRIDDSFEKLDTPIRQIQKDVENTRGRIDTLDAKLSGKIDLLVERGNSNSQGNSKE